MVQRHERRCFTLRFCSLWCEGFAPHTASSRFPIPRCVPLHHWRRDRDQFCRDEESCVIIHHDESACMKRGEAAMLVLRLAESVCVIPWVVVRCCKSTYGGARRRDSLVRRLRTTSCKRSLSDFPVCAFAPPQKRPHEESCVIKYSRVLVSG